MYNKTLLRLVFFVCLWAALPSITTAAAIPAQPSDSPCPSDETGTYYTKYGILSFVRDREGDDRWICYNGKVLTKTRPASNGGYYRLWTDDIQNESLREEGGKYVKKNGRKILLRMIVKEETGLDADPRYWMLDFRQEEPIVAGPMKARDSSINSRLYSVIWTDQSVIVILDDDGGPRGGSGSDWTKGAYQYIDKVLLEEDAEDKLSLITKNNRALKEGETLTTFDAYVYDYKNKKIIETDIEKEKTEAKRKKR